MSPIRHMRLFLNSALLRTGTLYPTRAVLPGCPNLGTRLGIFGHTYGMGYHTYTARRMTHTFAISYICHAIGEGGLAVPNSFFRVHYPFKKVNLLQYTNLQKRFLSMLALLSVCTVTAESLTPFLLNIR
jgi:hypothetical protein